MELEEGMIVYPCDICEKTFTQCGSRNWHIQKCHLPKEDKKLYECCGKEFTYKSSFKRHKEIHHGEPGSGPGKGVLYSCDVCGKTYTQCGSRNHHYQKCHLPEENNVYECCGKKFEYRNSFLRHKEAEHPLPIQISKNMIQVKAVLYGCAVCGKKFKRKEYLVQHNYWQHPKTCNAPTYECHHCNKKFQRKRNLQKHVKMHSAEFAMGYSRNEMNMSAPPDSTNIIHAVTDVATVESANRTTDVTTIMSPTSDEVNTSLPEDHTLEALSREELIVAVQSCYSEIEHLKQIILKKDEILQKFLNHDQVRALETGHLLWSSETILKALKLRISLSIDGYETICAEQAILYSPIRPL